MHKNNIVHRDVKLKGVSLVDLMVSPSSVECSFEDSKTRISTTKDDEHSGSKIRQASGLETHQGDGVEKQHIVEDELESQDTFW